jgi:protein-disulfide isomerase
VLSFGIAIAAAIALIAVALLFRSGNDAPETISAPVVDLAGIPQSGAVLGPSSARVTLIEYADPQCPACRYYNVSIFPTIVDEYIRPGKVKTEFRGFPFIGPDSVKALRFLLAAAKQNHLWDLEEALYRYQGAENDGWVTDDLIGDLATKIDGLDVDKLFSDASSAAITEQAEAASGQAQAAGIRVTPAFLVKIGDDEPYALQVSLDDVADFRAALDDAVAG